MNEQLQQTLTALKGGITGVDASAAASNVGGWHKTLPGLGSETEKLASGAPAADKDGLHQLATALKG